MLKGLIDKSSKIEYYRGVGEAGTRLSNILDGVSGRGVFRQARMAFDFIHTNYQAGDKIFIFGFSRGAYAAKHLAGMISRFGLHWMAEKTFDSYVADVKENPVDESYKATVSFLGLFDCVPGNQIYSLKSSSRALNNQLLEKGIENFAHAVAADERRWSFKPLLFKKSSQKRFEQVRFNGSHTDIGGGSNNRISYYSLLWMVRESYSAGLKFKFFDCEPVEDPEKRVHDQSLGMLGFVKSADPHGEATKSDYFTTKLGLKFDRTQLIDELGVKLQPDISELSECLRNCGKDFFDVFDNDSCRTHIQSLIDRVRVD